MFSIKEQLINSPKMVEKPWGMEIWLHNDEKYCGKILLINKNNRNSTLQDVKKNDGQPNSRTISK